jgi:RNA polymerase sigma-70 factor, ECF subfamily
VGHFAIWRHLLCMGMARHRTIGTSVNVDHGGAALGSDGPDAMVRAAIAGDEVAFAWLIDAYHGPMVRAAFVIVGHVDLSQEAAQNAWAIAWQRLPSLRHPERVRPWLVAICANEARQLLRRHKRREVREITARRPANAPADPAGAIDLVDLRRSLLGLSADDRRLVAMRYVTGLDSSQIAEAVGGTASGVRSRLARIVERLRKELDDA